MWIGHIRITEHALDGFYNYFDRQSYELPNNPAERIYDDFRASSDTGERYHLSNKKSQRMYTVQIKGREPYSMYCAFTKRGFVHVIRIDAPINVRKLQPKGVETRLIDKK